MPARRLLLVFLDLEDGTRRELLILPLRLAHDPLQPRVPPDRVAAVRLRLHVVPEVRLLKLFKIDCGLHNSYRFSREFHYLFSQSLYLLFSNIFLPKFKGLDPTNPSVESVSALSTFVYP